MQESNNKSKIKCKKNIDHIVEIQHNRTKEHNYTYQAFRRLLAVKWNLQHQLNDASM